MNDRYYRLVFSRVVGALVPVAENTRSQGKAGPASPLLLAGVLLALAGLGTPTAWAEVPVPRAGAGAAGFVGAGQAAYQVNGAQAFVNQVGDKSILNWQSFNLSAGRTVQFRQVDNLGNNQAVQGASFTSLNRIWDVNPSVIAGSLSQAAGQKANVILVNTNGIAFMGGAQVNLNSFTASSLNIADSFILGSFLTNQSQTPQFEGTGGFIKVFEGARISAGSQGRVMLIAPTVVNKGKVEAPDGQVVIAAGSKVYLRSASGQDPNVRGLLVEVDSPAGLVDFKTANPATKNAVLDGQTVALVDAATDKLGHATNLGELSAPRGNVTMVGYAVNQQGIARATTSVVANGSVYLLAKDRALNNAQSERGGRVTLAQGSLTEVLPDMADNTGTLDGATGAGLAQTSRVQVLGQDVRMAAGAVIKAPSGSVNIAAMDNPSQLAAPGDPFTTAGAPVSAVARVHIADGARINVAGLENLQVSSARNSVEVELRGDELKDSPINRQGPLRGQKVYVDINRAMANANAGKSTLIAKDSLESYQGRIERTVAERSTTGGTVSIRSQGEAILAPGAVIDLSGGSLQYTPGLVNTTLLSAGGVLTDLANATAEAHYEGIATRYVIDYGRWNRKEVIDLGQSRRYDPGYLEGKNAGLLAVIGMGGTVLQADIQGRTMAGELQRDSGALPTLATLWLGTDAVAGDYKLNQRVDFGGLAATLVADFGFGDVLPDELKDAVSLSPSLLGRDKVAHLQVFSNQAATVRAALRAPQGSSIAVIAKGIRIDADVEAAGAALSFSARANSVDTSSVPLDVRVADGVSLAARGTWANDLPAAVGRSPDASLVSGGSIALSAAGDVNLGSGSLLDVTGAARVKPDGKLQNGNGGNLRLEAGAGATAAGTHSAAVRLGGVLRGHALGSGGTLSINTGKIQIGGTPDVTALNLDADFVARGGFANFTLAGRDGVTVADGTLLHPTVESLELRSGFQLQPTGSRVGDFTRTVKRDDSVRQAANLTLVADGTTLGNVVVGTGSRIVADDRAAITLSAGNRIEIEGSVLAPGGTIVARLNRAVSENAEQQSTLWLGPQAVLDASGADRSFADTQGRRTGQVLAGGSVSLDAQVGYVVTQAGSSVRVNGAAPVSLDVLNETGGIGRMVGSDAGTVDITAREGILLDGALQALAGGPSNRGGTFNLRYGFNDDANAGFISPGDRVLGVAQTLAPQLSGSGPATGVAPALAARAQLSAQALEAAGFDRIALRGRDAIRLENGLAFGAGRVLPLKEIQLDAPRLETAGGDASLTAHTIRLGNYDLERQAVVNLPLAGSGSFNANAQLLELAGSQTFVGMARAGLAGAQEIRLAGVGTPSVARPIGQIKAAADLVFSATLVAPSTYSDYTIDANGYKVEFRRATDTPAQPLSALGSVTVKALDIVQDGHLWAPFGQIDLQAINSLVFNADSLTSVSATAGSLAPFGKVENGRNWIYEVDGSKIPVASLPQKSIRVSGSSIDMRSGARVDLAGGGDLQAYEFTVGPGGSRDMLTDKNSYAILPGATLGFAPRDAQEDFDRASGDAVHLSGVPGLADGVYTLLPAHYALLPGAYAVKLASGIQDLLPGQAYTRQDGVRIAAGYVTDSRSGSPKDARWSGIEVLTREQVQARSEFSLARASDFFAAGVNRPQDAGLLAIATGGTASDSLKLDAAYGLAPGSGGQGAALDISALKLALVSGTPANIDPDATRLDVDKLSALGAASLFIGGTRARTGSATALTVRADSLTLANEAAHALKAPEIILAARDTVTLRAGSLIDAQGEVGPATNYSTDGEGALLRAAAGGAGFTRGGSPGSSRGTLIGDASSTVRAADSITLDATRNNAFKGAVEFVKNGVPVAGNLAVGASRINFGAVPAGSEGITYSQAELDALNSLQSMAMTSYSSFDLYSDVRVGGVDTSGRPTLQKLTLQGAGLAGLDNNGQTASLRAQQLTLSNPSAAPYTPGGALGNGQLAVLADTFTLGQGNKAIQGYGDVTIRANEILGAGVGKTDVAAPATLQVARISGGIGSDQALTSSGALTANGHAAERVLTTVDTLGAKWALAGSNVDFNTQAVLPSGSFKLTANNGDTRLGAGAKVDVAGRSVQFFDQSRAAWAGQVELTSETGNVMLASGARVDVSAAPGGDAGTLVVRAVNGTATLAQGSVQGTATVDAQGRRGDGARVEVDTGTLASFSALNAALNGGGFDGGRTLRVRSGDVSVTALDELKAGTIHIAVDGGKLDVAGRLDASGGDAGRIGLFAKNDVNVAAQARLAAVSSSTGEDGGDIEIGTRDGRIDLATGSTLHVAGGSGGAGGTVLLRAPRTVNDVAVTSLGSAVAGARSVAVEALRVYDNITTLAATGGSGATLSLATINTNNTAFAANFANIKSRLGMTSDPAFHILSGVEVRSAADLTLNNDWNLSASRAGAEPGVLTLRAARNLRLNNNLSDGFNVATPLSGATPATVLASDSWAYRLIAGADSAGADPLAVKAGTGDVTLAAGKLVRTGTGDIRIASGRDIKFADNRAAIYTAGRLADAVNGFATPSGLGGSVNFAQFSQGGGDVSLNALRNVTSDNRSLQLYSNWLFRQGRPTADATGYVLQPAWWVRFDQFQQGVGALGGGDVRIAAAGIVENISASAPTQARMAGATPDASRLVTTGGGDVRVEAGGDLAGGQYYADRGQVTLKAGAAIQSGQKAGSGASAKPLYTILALGDAQARVQALGDVNIQAILNPHLVVQSSGSGNNVNIANAASTGWSLFSTYGAASGARLESLAGATVLHNVTNTATADVAGVRASYTTPLSLWTAVNYRTDLLSYLPPSLSATAFQGDLRIDGTQAILDPAAKGDLTLLARGSVNIPTRLTMSDMDPLLVPDALVPGTRFDQFNPALTATRHAVVPVHTDDANPVRVYALEGDVAGRVNVLNLTSPKPVWVRAGRDVRDLGIEAQHLNPADVSRIEAGRDVAFSESSSRNSRSYVWVGGPGRLEVNAGRNVDLGTSAGIVSRGGLDNTALPKAGADIQVTAGVGPGGIDYGAVVDRIAARLEAGSVDDATLWQARWLTDDETLTGSNALAAVRVVDALDKAGQRTRVREMVYAALLATGRDSNNPDSPYAADFARGYAALEMAFPGIGDKNPDGRFKNYQGEVNLFASRILTERGGAIEFLIPGGGLIVGLSNTRKEVLATQKFITGQEVGLTDSGALGLVAVEDGAIRGFARDDILVNQSRILTVGGGNILLWSSEGGIDAGKGAKTATSVPAPIIRVDSQGNVTQELQGAAAGSGIGALSSGGVKAGDVDLIAPKGTVNAGDAGIRAGNLNIAAQVVLGADNITVSGTSSGTPVADTSAVTAAASGATSGGDDISRTTAALNQSSADAARTSQTAIEAFKPSVVRVEVLGFGE